MDSVKGQGFLPPEDCDELRDKGYPQGKSRFLWHKDKHNHEKWELYERNPHDISAFGDKHGYNRWITAVTEEEASNFLYYQKNQYELWEDPEGDINAAVLQLQRAIDELRKD